MGMLSVALGSIFFVLQIYIYKKLQDDLPRVVEAWENWSEENCNNKTSEYRLSLLSEGLYDHINYKDLTKLQSSAPLLAMVIASLEFILLSKNMSMNTAEVFANIRPLYYGVLFGAVMAILGKFFLALADRKITALYQKCEQEIIPGQHELSEAEERLIEFSKKIQSLIPALDNLFLYLKEGTNTTIDKLYDRTELVTDRLDTFVKSVNNSTESLGTTSYKFQKGLEEVVPDIKDWITKLFSTVNFTMKSIQGTSGDIKDIVGKTSDIVEQSQKVINTTVKNSEESTKTFTEFCTKINESSALFQGGVTTFVDTSTFFAEKHKKIVEDASLLSSGLSDVCKEGSVLVSKFSELRLKINNTMIEIDSVGNNFQATSNELDGTIKKLFSILELELQTLRRPVDETSESLQEAIKNIQQCVADFERTIRLSNSQFGKNFIDINSTCSNFFSTCQQIQDGASLLQKSASQLHSCVSTLECKLRGY